MSIKTIRFNKAEEDMVKEITAHYGKDFSQCVKSLFQEKMEDLRDLNYIDQIKEGKPKDYVDANEINRLFDK